MRRTYRQRFDRHRAAREAARQEVLREMGLQDDPYRTPHWDVPVRRRRGRARSHPAVVLPIVIGVMSLFVSGLNPVAFFAFGFAALAFRSRRNRRQRARQQVARAANETLGPLGRRNRHVAPRQRQPQAPPEPALDLNSPAGLKAALTKQGNDHGAAEAQRLIELTARLERAAIDGGVTVPPELDEPVNALFAAARGILKKCVNLGIVMDQLSTPEAREESAALLTELLDDLDQTNDELGHILDRLQLRALRTDRPERDLGRIRKELDAQLEVARRVDERLDILDQDIDPDIMERESEYARE